MKDKCMHEYGERKPVAILSDNIASRCCPAGKSVYVVTTITCLWYNFGMLLIRYFLRPFLTGRSVSFLLSFSSIQGGCQQLPCCQPAKTFLLSLIPLERFVADSLDKDALLPEGDFTSLVAHSPCYLYNVLSIEISPWSHLLASLLVALPHMLLFLRVFPRLFTLQSLLESFSSIPWLQLQGFALG